jgi:hypothetical protein
MSLVTDWQGLEATLPPGWEEARVTLVLEEAGDLDRSVALLAPLQPVRAGRDTISLRVVRSGAGPAPEAVRRGLGRLDSERLHGRLSSEATATRPSVEPEPARAPVAEKTLAESWDEALATVPSDWTDILGEIELDSSDYLEPGAVQLAPINPRRLGSDQRLQFRSARAFGFGASPGMVRRCLERCDGIGIHGRVHIVRALSDTHPVGTQGPVWQIDGRTV